MAMADYIALNTPHLIQIALDGLMVALSASILPRKMKCVLETGVPEFG